MALISKTTKGRGWRHQAEQLASTHVIIGMAAMAVGGRGRKQPSFERKLEPRIFEPANEPEPMHAKLAEPKQQVLPEVAATQIMTNDHSDKPAAEPAVPVIVVAEPERTRDIVPLLSQIERRLKLLVSENLRLSLCLMERDLAEKRVAETERTRKINLSVARNELDLRARLLRCLADRDLANKRVAELERELSLVHEKLILQENENRSYRTSRSVADNGCSQTEQMIEDQLDQQPPSAAQQYYYTEENVWLPEELQRQMDMQQYGRSER
jgi:hypothetical protein